MKNRSKIIALMLGTVMTVSMASTSMAATAKTTQTTKTQQTATTEKTAKDDSKSDSKTSDTKKDEKKEEEEIFGKIKKIDSNTIELETAENENKNADTLKLVLDGKTSKVTVEKDTKYLSAAEKEDSKESTDTEKSTDSKKKNYGFKDS